MYRKVLEQRNYSVDKIIQDGNHIVCKVKKEGVDYVAKIGCSSLSHESKVLKELSDSDQIVKTVEYWEEKGEHYLILEYVGGVDLMDYVMRQALNDEQVAWIVHEIVKMLVYTESKGFYYGDLKLENIMITPQGKVIFIDFESCKTDERDGTYLLGTLHYHSILSFNTSFNISYENLWKIGVIIYTLLNNHYPFDGGNDISTKKKILKSSLNDEYCNNKDGRDLYHCLLRYKKRLSLQGILEHRYMKDNLPKKSPL